MVDADKFKREGNMRSSRMAFHLAKAVVGGTTGFIGATQMNYAHKLSQTTVLSENLDTSFAPVKAKPLDAVFFWRMCEIEVPNDEVSGVALQVSPEVAARAVLGLMKLGLLSKPASRLAAYPYEDAEMLERMLRNTHMTPARRAAARRIPARWHNALF